MKKIGLLILLMMVFALGANAQQRRGGKAKAKTQTTAKKTTPQKGKKGKGKGKTADYTNEEIRGLKNQQSQIQKEIKNQQGKLNANKADVQKRLQNLAEINGEIDNKQRDIEGFEEEITDLNGKIKLLEAQVSSLQKQLDERKQKYVKSMRYLARHRAIQDKLMFVFSAHNLTQAYRRLRFVRDYAKYQRTQGELIKQKQAEIDKKKDQLRVARNDKNVLLKKGKDAQRDLQSK